MKLKRILNNLNSLRVKIALIVFVMTLPLIAMLIYNNFYSIKIVREQVANSYKSTLNFHMNQLDTKLNDVDSYMQTISGNSFDLMALSLAANNAEYYMAKVYLYNKLKKDNSLFPTVDAFFVYNQPRQDYMNIDNKNISYDEQQILQNYLVQWIEDEHEINYSRTYRWKYIEIYNSYYIIDIVQAENTYLGAWIKVDHLLNPLKSLLIGQVSNLLFADDDGIAISDIDFIENNQIQLLQNKDYYLSGIEKKYIVVGAESLKANINLYALIPDDQILVNLPYLQKIIWIVSIIALLSIPLGMVALRQSILVPLNKVLIAMKRVRSGNWGGRVTPEKTSEEFKLLGHTFNTMMDEIEELRENVYEEKINKQREELQRLQVQLNPHFYLNTLNIIYNLAKKKNVELIKEMTLYLIKYFRYLFRSNTSFVKLQDEIEHTNNYLNIQKLRFPTKLSWDIESPIYLSETPVPPLIIQSFAENAIKHAITMEEAVQLNVQIILLEERKSSFIEITIKDTGPGFREDILIQLQQGLNVGNDLGEHTGLWNITRRLNLLYGEHARITFYNDPLTGGAAIQLILPIKLNLEGK